MKKRILVILLALFAMACAGLEDGQEPVNIGSRIAVEDSTSIVDYYGEWMLECDRRKLVDLMNETDPERVGDRKPIVSKLVSLALIYAGLDSAGNIIAYDPPLANFPSDSLQLPVISSFGPFVTYDLPAALDSDDTLR